VYDFYYDACAPQECTWYEPESVTTSLLATIAIVSGIYGVTSLVGRGIYSTKKRQNWQIDIGAMIKQEFERERKSQAEIYPSGSPRIRTMSTPPGSPRVDSVDSLPLTARVLSESGSEKNLNQDA